MDNTAKGTSCTPAAQMDETYYKLSGDCFLLLPSDRLREDSSIFNDMFSLPAPKDEQKQGASASDPIILHDTAEDFRALCWALYALPAELYAQSTCNQSNPATLISLVRMCKKYQFSTTEKWALTLFDTHLDHRSPCRFTDYLSDNIVNTLELSILCEYQRLTEHTMAKWLVKVKRGEIDIADSLATAERLGLRDFQGSLYYEQLLKLPALLPRGPVDSSLQSKALPLNLTLDQQRKLYNGFWSLSMAWSSFIAATAGSVCESYCRRRWLQIAYPDRREDLTGMYDYLKEFERMVDATEAGFRCSACQNIIHILVEDAQKKLKANLASHFLGITT